MSEFPGGTWYNSRAEWGSSVVPVGLISRRPSVQIRPPLPSSGSSTEELRRDRAEVRGSTPRRSTMMKDLAGVTSPLAGSY